MSGRVLVTGGAGFIGSHIAEAYLEEGWEVVVLDDLSRGHERNVPEARPVRPRGHPARPRPGSCSPPAASTRSTTMRPRSTCGSRSISPRSTPAINVVGFVNLLEGAGEGGVKRRGLRQQRRRASTATRR